MCQKGKSGWKETEFPKKMQQMARNMSLAPISMLSRVSLAPITALHLYVRRFSKTSSSVREMSDSGHELIVMSTDLR